jgi:rhamnulokinase
VTITRVVAVDLGASSGRVYTADIDDTHLVLEEVGRFANGAVKIGQTLYWDILALYQGMLEGVSRAGRFYPVASLGIDSWAVDYGLIRADGTLSANPIHHRDQRTTRAFHNLVVNLGAAEIYRRTGIALQPFNTLYQLATDARAGHLSKSSRALLIPDLLGYFLTGQLVAEETNASTTQLLDLKGAWDEDLIRRAGLPRTLLAPVVPPGHRVGEVSKDILAGLGVPGRLPVHSVASHDTASAVVATPAVDPDFAFISCGTWSLAGVELEHPIVTEAARMASFTNERGIDGTIRFLRNVMGLWLLQESVRTWERQGEPTDLVRLNRDAALVQPLRSLIDPNAQEYLTPGDMPARIAADCQRRGEALPVTPAEVTRCILDSLALAYSEAIRRAEEITGRAVRVIHLVGGGVNNTLLCQLTADACGVPVVAGPVESAAIGNALVQARVIGVLSADRWALRHFVRTHVHLQHYRPRAEMVSLFVAAGATGRGSMVS